MDHYSDTSMVDEEMNELKGRASLQLSDNDQSQDTRRLLSGVNGDNEGWHEMPTNPRVARQRDIYVLYAILLLSGFVNILQAVWLVGDSIRFTSAMRRTPAVAAGSSIFHESFGTVYRALYPPESYEFTLTSHVIDKQIGSFDPDKGVVALPKGQPHVLQSEAFPWDPTKEVYVLSGYHSLHSLKLLWTELHNLTGNEPLSTHVLHSLNVLWEDTLCAARTDPMTISEKLIANRTAINEAGQTRQCRAWDEVQQFRTQHSACFKGMGGARKQKEMIEEWQFCPEGSPYKAVVDKYIAEMKQTTD